jgi:hypothetical protein
MASCEEWDCWLVCEDWDCWLVCVRIGTAGFCLRIGTSGLWFRNDIWVVTDVSTYRSCFIFNGQLVQEGCSGMLDPKDGGTLIIKTAASGYPKTRRHIMTSVRYSAHSELHKLLIIAMWRAIVAAQLQCHCPHSYSVTVRTATVSLSA